MSKTTQILPRSEYIHRAGMDGVGRGAGRNLLRVYMKHPGTMDGIQ